MKHFITLTDLTPRDLQSLLDLAVELKKELKSGGNRPILAGKSLAMLFQKPSLRTRVSFEMGMHQLGGYALSLSPQEVKMGVRETPADVARVLSGYVDGVMARVTNHQELLELSDFSDIPVINGLSDYNHPVQALTDLFTILEIKGGLRGVHMTYVGDGNNVARSLLWGAMMTGMHFTLSTPPEYSLDDNDIILAENVRSKGATFQFIEDPRAAVEAADVLYTDVWTSMGQETEKEARLNAFPPYQINQELLDIAGPDCHVMHCLPAVRGQEISAAVADGPRSVIFQQAENRMHAQKAVLARLMADSARS